MRSFCSVPTQRAPDAPYKYFATENGGDCRCGNRFREEPQPSRGCNERCTGNPSEACGGRHRLNIWQNEDWQEVRPYLFSKSVTQKLCSALVSVFLVWGTVWCCLRFGPGVQQHRMSWLVMVAGHHISMVRGRYDVV